MVNLNRQRFTGGERGVWGRLLDFVTRQEIWEQPCEGCPGAESTDDCPMLANAAALRKEETREVLRNLVQGASGSQVLTIRELLSLIAYAICGDSERGSGGWSCQSVKKEYKNRGRDSFHSSAAFFNLVVGLIERQGGSATLRRLGGLAAEAWAQGPASLRRAKT